MYVWIEVGSQYFRLEEIIRMVLDLGRGVWLDVFKLDNFYFWMRFGYFYCSEVIYLSVISKEVLDIDY